MTEQEAVGELVDIDEAQDEVQSDTIREVNELTSTSSEGKKEEEQDGVSSDHSIKGEVQDVDDHKYKPLRDDLILAVRERFIPGVIAAYQAIMGDDSDVDLEEYMKYEISLQEPTSIMWSIRLILERFDDVCPLNFLKHVYEENIMDVWSLFKSLMLTLSEEPSFKEWLNKKNANGQSLSHWIAHEQDTSFTTAVYLQLQKMGLDATSRDSAGKTAYIIAAARGNVLLMQALESVDKELVKAEDDLGRCAIHWCVYSDGNRHAIKHLIVGNDKYGVCEMLISRDHKKNTAMHYMAKGGAWGNLVFILDYLYEDYLVKDTLSWQNEEGDTCRVGANKISELYIKEATAERPDMDEFDRYDVEDNKFAKVVNICDTYAKRDTTEPWYQNAQEMYLNIIMIMLSVLALILYKIMAPRYDSCDTVIHSALFFILPLYCIFMTEFPEERPPISRDSELRNRDLYERYDELMVMNFELLTMAYDKLISTKGGGVTLSKSDKQGNIECSLMDKCYICNVVRGPRTYHCHECKKCIPMRDHHCAWVNGCISDTNILYFFTYLLLCLYTGVVGIIITFKGLYKMTRGLVAELSKADRWYNSLIGIEIVALIVLFFVLIASTYYILIMFFEQLTGVAGNVTYNELAKWSEIQSWRETFYSYNDEKGQYESQDLVTNPFSGSLSHNVKQFFLGVRESFPDAAATVKESKMPRLSFYE